MSLYEKNNVLRGNRSENALKRIFKKTSLKSQKKNVERLLLRRKTLIKNFNYEKNHSFNSCYIEFWSL